MVWRQFESPGDIGERMVTRHPPKKGVCSPVRKKTHGGWKIKEVRLYLLGMYYSYGAEFGFGDVNQGFQYFYVEITWNHGISSKFLGWWWEYPWCLGPGYVNDLWTIVRLVNSLTFIACGCFGNEDIFAALAMHFLCEEGVLMYSFIMKPISI